MPERRLLQHLDAMITALFCSVVAIAVVDTVLVAFRSGARSSLWYWLSCLAAGTWVALLVGGALLCIGVVARWLRVSPGGVLWGAGWGACVGLTLLFIIRVWDLDGDPYQLRLLVPVACTPLGAALSLAWRRVGKVPLCTALCAAALVAFFVDAFAFRRLYLGFHNAAAFLALTAAFLVFVRLDVRVARFPIVGAVALATSLLLFSDLSSVRAIGVEHGALQPKLLRFVHVLVDRDNDGYAAVLGGGDCDDSDPAVRPGRCEIPNNGKDDNCNGTEQPIVLSKPMAALPVTKRAAVQPDIYIVLADALRADYGGSDAIQHLTRFAQQSLNFTNAHTPYPSTYRALIATLQARHWRHVGPHHPTLLRLLAKRGYDVRLFIADHRLTEPESGAGLVDLERSSGDPFHVPNTPDKSAWTARIVDHAIAELDQENRPPQFRWLHFLDAHSPCLRGGDGDSPLECYQKEVAHVSSEFGRFVQALHKTERGRAAVVVFVSDHGEEFGEHEGAFHGATLFNEVTRVPMVMHLPGVAPRVIAQATSLLDIAPTLLGYLGIDRPAGHQGHDHLSPNAPTEARVLSEVESVDNFGGLGLPALAMAMNTRFKVVLNVTDNLISLYDLQQDPGEQRNIYWTSPNFAEALVSLISGWQDISDCRPK